MATEHTDKVRFRFTLGALVLGAAAVAILLAIALLLSARHDVESRRLRTLEGLESMNVSRARAATRHSHDLLLQAVREATYSSLKTPRIVTARLTPEHPDVRKGFFIEVEWLCRAPDADGVQIGLSDGTTTNIRFSAESLAENGISDGVLFYGLVSSAEFPALTERIKPSDIRSVSLLCGSEVCSNSLFVDPSDQE